MALPHNGVCKSAHNIDNQTFKEFKALSGSPALSCRPAARQAVLPHILSSLSPKVLLLLEDERLLEMSSEDNRIAVLGFPHECLYSSISCHCRPRFKAI